MKYRVVSTSYELIGVSYTCWAMTKPIHNEPNNRSVERKINSSFFVMRGGRGWEKD